MNYKIIIVSVLFIVSFILINKPNNKDIYLQHLDNTIGQQIKNPSDPIMNRFSHSFSLCVVDKSNNYQLQNLLYHLTQFLYEQRLLDITLDIKLSEFNCSKDTLIYLLVTNKRDENKSKVEQFLSHVKQIRGWNAPPNGFLVGDFASSGYLFSAFEHNSYKTNWGGLISFNDLSKEEKISDYYLRAVLHQELFQVITTSLDNDVVKTTRSVAQEINYLKNGVQIYPNETVYWNHNPKNLCLFDIITLVSLYYPKMKYIGNNYNEFIQHVKNNYEYIEDKAIVIYQRGMNEKLIVEPC